MIRLLALLAVFLCAPVWATCTKTVDTLAGITPGVTSQSCTAASTGDPIYIFTHNRPTITAVPGGGGTITVEYTTSTPAQIVGGTATWTAWPDGTAGSVSAATSDVPLGTITAVRQKPVTAAGVLEVVQ